MQSQISTIMNDLVQNPSEVMPYQVQAMSQRRWLIEADAGPIVQFELLDDGRSALIYATTARDGSGPLRSSFITMLILELRTRSPMFLCHMASVRARRR